MREEPLDEREVVAADGLAGKAVSRLYALLHQSCFQINVAEQVCVVVKPEGKGRKTKDVMISSLVPDRRRLVSGPSIVNVPSMLQKQCQSLS